MQPGKVIGVDVGGTKTHVRVECGPDRLADYVIPTSQWWSPGSAIECSVNAAALMRELGGDRVVGSALVVGAHGIDSDRVADDLATELGRLSMGPVRVLNDAGLVGPAAGYPGAVISVIAGTGSIVLAMDDLGVEVRLGGHGYLVGDEGSAPALVRDLVRDLLREWDRGRPDRIALTHLSNMLGLPPSAEPEEDLAAEFQRRHSITDWGRLAPAVFAAADAGSPLAATVIQRHASELVELVELHIAGGQNPGAVVLAGGVVTAQPRLAEAIRVGVHQLHPRLPVVLLTDPPVGGAVLLARQELALLSQLSHSANVTAESSPPVARSRAHIEGSRS
ncbi:BadF/BadG/BcrA/BcrD ATPase family protein [Tessaracoccus antarcticus]|uniref:BadF/BadG/BcrA/BcrD ATPase family protein n=1 Tax=Tessaracoccus antarcticus TaxID=2479848 RepID=UPI0013141F88|nr:BadF/BadG/BcrA/BcrD ATPase family protein [Tessaracoccus antarcticus]